MLGIPNAGCYHISHPIPANAFLLLISEKGRKKLQVYTSIQQNVDEQGQRLDKPNSEKCQTPSIATHFSEH